MIDERRLDDFLREAGDELDRLAGEFEPEPTTQSRGWAPYVAIATVAAGVAALTFVVADSRDPAGTGSAPSRSDDASAVVATASVALTSTTAPTPVTEPDPIATLPFLMLVAPSGGLGQPTSIQTWNGKDFEPPAHLLGWVDPSADVGLLVPVVVSPQWMEPFPDARDVDSGNVTGWIANLEGDTVGSFNVDGMSASVRVESDAIPDSDVIALMSGLPPSLEVGWGAGEGPPEAFVEIARQADDAYLHVTTYSDGEGASPTFGTLTDYPLNGLTLEREPTVSQVVAGGRPGFVLRSSSAGVATAALYWPCGETYRCMLGYSGGVNVPSDAELVALAQHTRPATPAEIEQFEEL